MSFRKTALFGFDFVIADSVTEVVAGIMTASMAKPAGKIDFLITPNASTTLYYSEPEHRALKNFYAHAAYILPDGMPIVWLSKVLSPEQLHARLTGSDLFPELWTAIKKAGLPVTMVLANQGLAERYVTEYSLCNTVVPKFFAAEDDVYIRELAAAVADRIIANRSSFVFLGLNFPKQEKLGMAVALELRQRQYEGNVLVLLLGASFEFYFGLKKRAPEFYKRTGLEWLYRLMKEPRRLWKRYTRDNVRFLALVIRETVRRRPGTKG